MSLFSLFTGSFCKQKAAEALFVETKDYEKGFAQHYDKHLKDRVEIFEAKRIEHLKKASFRLKLSLLFMIIFVIVIFSINNEVWQDEGAVKIALTCFLASVMGAGYWVHQSINAYCASIKSDIFPNILSFLGDYDYFPTGNTDISSFVDSSIIPKYDRASHEDEIIGQYKGVGIKLFETHLETEHYSKNGKSYQTRFKGVVISLDMNKEFLGKTIVKRDKGSIRNWFTAKGNKDLDNVRLENPNFEKKFEVFSSDQVEARYLLTTVFMERLLELQNNFGGTSLECSFFGNKLLIMIAVNKNLFEPGPIYEPENFVDDAQNLLKEMNDIFAIIDLLKLHEKSRI